MIDIFLMKDVRALFKHKSVVFMGDSNVRALYKDFLCLMHESYMIPETKLKAKMEKSLYNDRLTYHGAKNNGRNYREERQVNSCQISASFYFITKVYDDYVKSVLNKITADQKPDVLIINSLLWDITRWGASGVDEFKSNLTHLMKHLRDILPDCLVIWVTAPPISSEVRGGFLVPDLQFLKYSLRFHVVEANHFARDVVVKHGFDVVDSHYHLKSQIHRRCGDGIHWLPEAVRYVLNLLLTHISLAWNVPLPQRNKSSVMEEYLERLEDEISEVEPVQIKVEHVQSTQKKATPSKKNKKKRSPNKKPLRCESYKSHCDRTRLKERRQRIKRWQASTTTPSHPQHSQNDSGYFPSPGTDLRTYLSNDSLYSRHSALSVENSMYSNRWQDTYYATKSNSGSSGYYYEKGRTLLEVPYSFPHVVQNQVLHPRIDFTSDDFSVFTA